MGECPYIGIVGLGNDDLITRIAECHEDELQSFASASSDHKILWRNIHTKGLVVGGQGLPEVQITLALPIGDYRGTVVLDRPDDLGRGLNVGLTDIEMKNVDSPPFGIIGVGNQSPDR